MGAWRWFARPTPSGQTNKFIQHRTPKALLPRSAFLLCFAIDPPTQGCAMFSKKRLIAFAASVVLFAGLITAGFALYKKNTICCYRPVHNMVYVIETTQDLPPNTVIKREHLQPKRVASVWLPPNYLYASNQQHIIGKRTKTHIKRHQIVLEYDVDLLSYP